MIAQTKAEADKRALEHDVIGKMQVRKLVTDTYAPSDPVEGVAFPDKVENAKEYVAMSDIRFAGSSGPMLIRRGAHITSPSLIGELLRLRVDIKAIA